MWKHGIAFPLYRGTAIWILGFGWRKVFKRKTTKHRHVNRPWSKPVFFAGGHLLVEPKSESYPFFQPKKPFMCWLKSKTKVLVDSLFLA